MKTFQPSQRVRIAIETLGDDAHGQELRFPSGTVGLVDGVEPWGVTVCIGNIDGPEETGMIVNVFEGDELDLLEVVSDLGQEA